MAQITGKATIYVDGEQLQMENGAKANPGGISRQFERHGGRTYGREEEVVPSVEGNVLHTKDVDVLTLSAIEDATIIFECDTGQKYVMRNGAVENPVEIDAGSGKSAIKFVGDSFDKQ
ncbi:phage tail tube protein [Candidatus Vondammii sp. HM_W22]|uniref:phage tail tube protein n=1 Tax=Candidatus Vondammii sp. HM_W22 TaxID=2687299 RepID=UPI001F13188A|nr:phage tail tube protein [Candidatus Vondammii sp. HM_W22]